MKVVVNRCFGGFSISRKAAEIMAARGNERAKKEIEKTCFTKGGKEIKKPRWFGYGYVDGMDGAYERTDPDLVAAVEELGSEASGEHAELEVREIPDGIDWYIDDYDGVETIHQNHQSW